jgi:hypothetical protein
LPNASFFSKKKDGFCPYTLWTHVMHVFGLVMGI